ncbi:glycosyltransferase family 17-domain-containing protein [Bombardia bombarda]|uniref:Glycosyltransferase family 17-domain-containing protein n=1 Tax=Bombardia bombarda TaxID=252184 RepID=A0AA39WME4_9PEZI|nr:glycosyltransferase family 17-domain-containing protein [Bombardia bombarda]
MLIQRWACPPSRWARIAVLISIVWVFFYLSSGQESSFFISPVLNGAESRINQHNDDNNGNICQQHGWKPFKQSRNKPPRKVYDLVMVNTELDWLEIRLNSTWDAVDYFVLVESNRTFTNHPKPLVLKANLDTDPQLAPYASKIIYHQVAFPPNHNPSRAWDNEDLQRNAMFTQVFPTLRDAQSPNPSDVIVVSDVDEIPARRPSPCCAFQYRHRGAQDWPHPQATYYQGLWRTVKPNDLRVGLGFPPAAKWWDAGEVANASWHCSSCFGTVEELLTKLGAFAHTWMNADQYRDRKRIVDRVRRGRDIWDREGEVYDRVENNTDVPGFLRENPGRFPYVLSRDGEAGGLVIMKGDKGGINFGNNGLNLF